MHRVFPSPAGRVGVSCRILFLLVLVVLAVSAGGCDQNMSDQPLPRASAEELERLAARLSEAPSLSVPAGATISGLIELAPRLAALTSPGDVVFVIAREVGEDAPPIAVERLTGNAYPMRFVLDTASAPPPDAPGARSLQLVVKVDKDGDAGTSSEADLVGFTPGAVRPGDSGVRVEVEATLGEIAATLGEQVPETGTASAGEGAITGTILLPRALSARTARDDVVFVIAREPGTAGPPVAVARLSGNAYPMPFVLDEGSLMRGGSWPERVELEVRVDRDGDALTRAPEELSGRAPGPVRPGQRDVQIELEG